MRIEWTSYQSPVGVLTILEAREGPLIVEFAERTGRLHLAERLRDSIGKVGPREVASHLSLAFSELKAVVGDVPALADMKAEIELLGRSYG